MWRLLLRAKRYRRNHALRKTKLIAAVQYLLKYRRQLHNCLVQVPSRIENVYVENAFRPIKLGAKNWLFIGHPNAGPRAAALFTLAENRRIAGINPEEYFTDLLIRLPEHPISRIAEFIPQNWAKSKNTPAD